MEKCDSIFSSLLLLSISWMLSRYTYTFVLLLTSFLGILIVRFYLFLREKWKMWEILLIFVFWGLWLGCWLMTSSTTYILEWSAGGPIAAIKERLQTALFFETFCQFGMLRILAFFWTHLIQEFFGLLKSSNVTLYSEV